MSRSTGEAAGESLESATRYWMYRAAGLVIRPPSAAACGALQALHVLSGSAELPVLVSTLSVVPEGTLEVQRTAPHRETCFASCTTDSYVPFGAALSGTDV